MILLTENFQIYLLMLTLSVCLCALDKPADNNWVNPMDIDSKYPIPNFYQYSPAWSNLKENIAEFSNKYTSHDKDKLLRMSLVALMYESERGEQAQLERICRIVVVAINMLIAIFLSILFSVLLRYKYFEKVYEECHEEKYVKKSTPYIENSTKFVIASNRDLPSDFIPEYANPVHVGLSSFEDPNLIPMTISSAKYGNYQD